KGYALRMDLLGARNRPRAAALNALASQSNYLLGNDPTDWRTGLRNFRAIRYHNVYAGVDLRYYGNQGQLEYDFIVRPGADPKRIRLNFAGAKSVRIGDDGSLVIRLNDKGDEIRFKRPVAYQHKDGRRVRVRSRYLIGEDGQVRLKLGKYDRSLPLVIDPVLNYGTFLGGSGVDQAQGVAVDSSGNAYAAGQTASAAFPTTVGAYDTTQNSSNDVFVTKLNSSGTGILSSTFIGGSGNDIAWALAVDAGGNA